jgi:hypothetical protein
VIGFREMWTEAAVKALVYAAVLPTIGAAAAFWIVEPDSAIDAGIRWTVERAIRRVGLCASIAVVLALLARAWAHTAATFGVAQALTWDALSTVALQSR